jgi:hypothetical protein
VIGEILDIALDLVGDIATFELLLRFGWPRARTRIARACLWLLRIPLLAGGEADPRERMDEQLRARLVRLGGAL